MVLESKKTAPELKLDTAEVTRILGVSKDFIPDLTKEKRGKKPFFTPAKPASGSGRKHLFSFSDLIALGVIKAAMTLKLQRLWIHWLCERSDALLKRLDISDPERHPYHPNFLKHFHNSEKDSPRFRIQMKVEGHIVLVQWLIDRGKNKQTELQPKYIDSKKGKEIPFKTVRKRRDYMLFGVGHSPLVVIFDLNKIHMEIWKALSEKGAVN